VPISGEPRVIPVEYAGRYRDALGVPLPTGLPESLLQPSANAGLDLARRYSRTHGPFTTGEFAHRYGLGRATADMLLKELASAAACSKASSSQAGRGVNGATARCCSRSAGARWQAAQEVEPVDPPILGRLITSWQGVVRRRLGLDALLDTIENLQGAPLPASIFESEILAARIEGYNPCRPRRPDRRAAKSSGVASSRWASGRPHRALPDRSFRAACGVSSQRPICRPGATDRRPPHRERRLVLRRSAPRRRRRLPG
jgi:ATP-dependent Lhr-like helicase